MKTSPAFAISSRACMSGEVSPDASLVSAPSKSATVSFNCPPRLALLRREHQAFNRITHRRDLVGRIFQRREISLLRIAEPLVGPPCASPVAWTGKSPSPFAAASQTEPILLFAAAAMSGFVALASGS